MYLFSESSVGLSEILGIAHCFDGHITGRSYGLSPLATPNRHES